MHASQGRGKEVNASFMNTTKWRTNEKLKKLWMFRLCTFLNMSSITNVCITNNVLASSWNT
jgi:hypothetical protein